MENEKRKRFTYSLTFPPQKTKNKKQKTKNTITPPHLSPSTDKKTKTFPRTPFFFSLLFALPTTQPNPPRTIITPTKRRKTTTTNTTTPLFPSLLLFFHGCLSSSELPHIFSLGRSGVVLTVTKRPHYRWLNRC